jgi:cell division protein FtsL
MNTKTIQNHMMQNTNPYRKVFKGLVSYTILLTGLYLFFIGGIVFNIIAKKDVQSQVRELTSKISGMESEYLAMAATVNMDGATAKGFVQNKNIEYIKRPNVSLANTTLR